ncbi:hypothetical protein Tco_0057953 [Tanacetum coccineum]
MNLIVAQQVALDNALVAPEKRLKIEKCNARIELNKPQREATYQVTLHALKLSPCYPAFLITAEICLTLTDQDFVEPPSDEEMVPFIQELGASLGRPQVLIGSCRQELKSCGEYYQKYGALILEEMINQDIKDSKAYKTYLDFATGKATPKKARKFKKIASPSKKLSPVLEEEPAKKPKQAKKPAKKSTTVPTAGVVIRDTPGVSVSKKKAPAKVDRGKGMDLLSEAALLEAAQLKKALKKSKQDTHILHASGSGDGVGSKLKVHDESQDKTTGTNEETGDNDDDSNDDDSDDDVESNADGDNEASDSERTDEDEDENPNLNLNDDEEEEYEEEYVRTPENYEFINDKEEYEELYKDVNVRLKDAKHEQERKGDAEMTDAGHEYVSQEKSYEQVKDDAHVTLTAAPITQKTEADNKVVSMMNVKVRHEEPSTQTPSLLTIPVTKSVKEIIKDEVNTQLPHILPKEISNFATRVIQSTITKSLENVVLAKSSSQPQSTYEAATSLTKFELKKILLDKMQKSKSYRESKSSSSKGTKSQPKSSGKFAQAEESMFEAADTEMPQNEGSDLGNTNDQPNVEAALKHDWFKKPERPSTLDPDWNARKYGHTEVKWNSNIISKCYKAVTYRLDWNNPKGQKYPFDLSKPLLLIKDRDRQVVPVNYFINNDLEYLKGGSLSRKYTTSTTKTKAAKVSKHDVFSTKRIITVTHVKVMKWYDYGYLEEIEVRREDQKLYKFKEGDFPRLNLRDIEYMLLLLVQNKISNLERDFIFDLNVALRMFTRRVVILKRTGSQKLP